MANERKDLLQTEVRLNGRPVVVMEKPKRGGTPWEHADWRTFPGCDAVNTAFITAVVANTDEAWAAYQQTLDTYSTFVRANLPKLANTHEWSVRYVPPQLLVYEKPLTRVRKSKVKDTEKHRVIKSTGTGIADGGETIVDDRTQDQEHTGAASATATTATTTPGKEFGATLRAKLSASKAPSEPDRT